MLAFLGFNLSCIVLGCICVHVEGLPNEVYIPHQRELLSPTEITAPALPEKPSVESSLYLRYLLLRHYVNVII